MSKMELHNALGPLAALFEDPYVTEVMVDGPEHITIEKHGRLEDTTLRFKSNNEIKAAIEATLNAIGVELEQDRTIYDVHLSDNTRMIAVLSPSAVLGHSLIFRKFRVNQVSWEDLLKLNSISLEARELIQSALNAQVNILVAGGTASGKTTLTNRIVELIPAEQRVIAIEQVHEFQFNHPRAVFLEADDSSQAGMNDLLVAGSKMRPDWLVVGELLGAEAMRVMQIFSNGHSGITTIHSTGVENALHRLEVMCLMANMGLAREDIREMVASALRLVIYQECLEPKGNRKVTTISEIRGVDNNRYVLQPLMRYNPEKDTFDMTGVQPGWV